MKGCFKCAKNGRRGVKSRGFLFQFHVLVKIQVKFSNTSYLLINNAYEMGLNRRDSPRDSSVRQNNSFSFYAKMFTIIEKKFQIPNSFLNKDISTK